MWYTVLNNLVRLATSQLALAGEHRKESTRTPFFEEVLVLTWFCTLDQVSLLNQRYLKRRSFFVALKGERLNDEQTINPRTSFTSLAKSRY
jgi:hypothetical protein